MLDRKNHERQRQRVSHDDPGRHQQVADRSLRSGTIGPQAADISKLYGTLGIFTYDVGYGATAACESKITYIDGDEGVLLHRGYPIDQLAEKSTFLEVAYLLLNGELPTEAERDEFDHGVMRHTMLHEQLRSFYSGFRRDAHPMAVMCGVVGALSAFYHDSLDINERGAPPISAFRLIAKLPTIAAWAYKYNIGQPFMYPRNDLGYAENFLYMLNAVPAEEYHVNPVLARAMDRIFILHADHEQNASTSTVRLAGSTGANPFACIAAGIASLWGPAHGGANEAVLKMLNEIGSPANIPAFIEKVKDKNSHVRLMGFGHRVYKNYDPRAKIMERTCHEVLKELGIKDDPTLDMAMELERIALQRRLFRQQEAVSQRRFLFGHHPQGDGHPDQHVHRAVRRRPHRRLDQPVEGDGRGQLAADRPPAADLHRLPPAGLRSGGRARLRPRAGRPRWTASRQPMARPAA